jgi:hypothetical protein
MTKFHLCLSNIYQFKGWTFEYNAAFGPWPLNKNGEPKKRAGDKFNKVFSEFFSLPDEKKEQYRIECRGYIEP